MKHLLYLLLSLQTLVSFAQGRSETVQFCIDKQVYGSYDTLYVSGLLIAPDGATYSELSRYCIVELFSEQDTIVDRLKVRCEGATFHARFALGDIGGHSYLLVRAYTQFMRNFPERLWPMAVAGIAGKKQVPVLAERRPAERGSLQMAFSKGVLVYKYVTMEPTDEIFRLNFYAGGQLLGSRMVQDGNCEGSLVPDSLPGSLICGILTDTNKRIVASRFLPTTKETLPFTVEMQTSGYEPARPVRLMLKGQTCDTPLLIRMEKEEGEEDMEPGSAMRLIPAAMQRFMTIGGDCFEQILTCKYTGSYPPEQVLSIRGIVKTENGNRFTREGILVAFNNETGNTYESEIDKEGNFLVGTDDFKDGDSFFLQVYDRKGKSGYHTIEVEESAPSEIVLPQIRLTTPPASVSASQPRQVDTSRVHALPEVKIVAPARGAYTNTVKFYRNNYLEWTDIRDRNYTELEYILRAMPGIRIIGGLPYSTRGQGAMSSEGKSLPINVDGAWIDLKSETGLKNAVTVADIATIEYIPAIRAFARFGSRAFDGVIAITTHWKKESLPVPSQGRHYKPLGLSDNRPFLPSIPLRSLMLRKGEVREVLLEAPAFPGKYRVILEGVGLNHTVAYQSLDIEVR